MQGMNKLTHVYDPSMQRIEPAWLKQERVFQLQRAAADGNPNAQAKLSILHFNGDGVEKDIKLSFFYAIKANEKGYSEAIDHLLKIENEKMTPEIADGLVSIFLSKQEKCEEKINEKIRSLVTIEIKDLSSEPWDVQRRAREEQTQAIAYELQAIEWGWAPPEIKSLIQKNTSRLDNKLTVEEKNQRATTFKEILELRAIASSHRERASKYNELI